MKTYKRPGTAWRAAVAFILLNLPLLVTAYAIYHLAGGSEAEWWARGILAVVIAVAEFSVVTSTIAPPLYEWIKSEEVVADGAKPSWER